MSAEELGSGGKWFGDDYDRSGLFGNTPPRFGEELKPRGGEAAGDLDKHLHPFQGDGGRPPRVAMETASTGKKTRARLGQISTFAAVVGEPRRDAD